jgi:hypothetical protein
MEYEAGDVIWGPDKGDPVWGYDHQIVALRLLAPPVPSAGPSKVPSGS